MDFSQYVQDDLLRLAQECSDQGIQEKNAELLFTAAVLVNIATFLQADAVNCLEILSEDAHQLASILRTPPQG